MVDLHFGGCSKAHALPKVMDSLCHTLAAKRASVEV